MNGPAITQEPKTPPSTSNDTISYDLISPPTPAKQQHEKAQNDEIAQSTSNNKELSSNNKKSSRSNIKSQPAPNISNSNKPPLDITQPPISNSMSQTKHDMTRSQNNSGINSPRRSRLYQKRKCLLIHDDEFRNYDQNKFSNQFDVLCYKLDKLSDLDKHLPRLDKCIKQTNPECIFIHLGSKDVLDSKEDNTNTVIENYFDLIYHLLDDSYTTANICISSIIPPKNNESLKKRVKVVNNKIENEVTDLRNEFQELRERIFTYNNDGIAWQKLKVNNGYPLTVRGQLIMWKRLKDGLRKTLRLPRPLYPRKNTRKSDLNNSYHG